MAASADVIIVGGGIAGLSLATMLAPHARVLLLEREPLLASQASGSNAAIFRPLEHDPLSAELARRSRELLQELIGEGVLAQHGLWLVSRDPEPVMALARMASELQLSHETASGGALIDALPWLSQGRAEHGLCLREGGVLDLHLLTSTLARLARARGAELLTGVRVAGLELDARAQRIVGVRLATGDHLTAAHVVLAAGAWSAGLAGAVGLGLPLTPLRRHLVQLTATVSTRLCSPPPVIWRIDDEVYFRSESGGILASPCDETPWPAETPPENDAGALLTLAQKLEQTAPALVHARVHRAWACLRTFAPDRELAIGPDPRVQGLHWFAGLGGRGMSVALAVAEILTRSLLSPPQAARYTALTIARLL